MSGKEPVWGYSFKSNPLAFHTVQKHRPRPFVVVIVLSYVFTSKCLQGGLFIGRQNALVLPVRGKNGKYADIYQPMN